MNYMKSCLLFLCACRLVASQCDMNGSCIKNLENFLTRISNVSTAHKCRSHCQENSDCEIFTWYKNGSHLLALTCNLFKSCNDVDTACTDAVFGARLCGREAECKVPLLSGGDYYCPGNYTDRNANVNQRNLSFCYFTCKHKLFIRQCLNGRWTGNPASCRCKSPPPGNQLSCDKEPTQEQEWEGDTVCVKTCKNFGTIGRTVCRQSDWQSDLSNLECYDDNINILLAIVLSLVVVILLALVAVIIAIRITRRRRRERALQQNILRFTQRSVVP